MHWSRSLCHVTEAYKAEINTDSSEALYDMCRATLYRGFIECYIIKGRSDKASTSSLLN
ncbi:hypothetical protein HanIR_Chr12g0612241 [Helianthus annuus]|nr:hypothetical protein HanIR_Chr12g0612241 [Helianthus annuus]